MLWVRYWLIYAVQSMCFPGLVDICVCVFNQKWLGTPDLYYVPVNYYFVLFAGLFFIYPCMDRYIKIDMRTVSFDVPPQEVSYFIWYIITRGKLFY